MGLACLVALTAQAASAINTQEIAKMSDETECCAVFELRQYALKPGQRDVLIDIFDREFVESQEAAGMRVLGQFRDDLAPDRFVWIRAFRDMTTRREGLTSFYSGPVWKAHGRQAASTMVDSDDVVLLRPLERPSGLEKPTSLRPPAGASALPQSIVVATIYRLAAGAERDFSAFFREAISPALRDCGIVPLATFETETESNDYPQLPVRVDARVFVWFALFGSVEAHDMAMAKLSQSPAWAKVESIQQRYLASPREQLRLRPTARSLLH
jgi:NIPSNAP